MSSISRGNNTGKLDRIGCLALVILFAWVTLAGCRVEESRTICDEAARMLADCTETEPVLVDSCNQEERREAEDILTLGCDAFDPGKADFADIFKCSFLGKKAGACNRLPNEDEELLTIGAAGETALPDSKIEVLIWNCYKGQKDGWDREVRELVRDVDIVVFQEFLLDGDSTDTFEAMDQFQWFFATSFFNHVDESGVPSGVVTGSAVEPVGVDYRRSPVREPVANTPKMSLYTRYALPGSDEELLVVNVHAINFRLSGAFERHMVQVGEVIRSHRGPILAAGDFNTWISIRKNFLDDLMASHGLEQVWLENDTRDTKLDHVYVRNLTPEMATLLPGVDSSDHKPILLSVLVD